MEIFNALLQIDLENFVGNILKERLEIDSFSKSDLFMAVEFNKKLAKNELGEWFGCIMNNCEAKTKNLRQFPASPGCLCCPESQFILSE